MSHRDETHLTRRLTKPSGYSAPHGRGPASLSHMRSFIALLLIPLLTSASALALFTVPLTKLQRTGTYLKGSPDADRARAAFLKRRTASGPVAVPATNLAYVQYTTRVGIGNPPTYYNLVIDTGSSTLSTSTSIPTGENVEVYYGSGFFSGKEYLDQVTLAPNLVSMASSGVGPVDLTLGTFSPDKNATAPTVMNNLMSQGLIENKVLGVYFGPATNYSDKNGALTYGGADLSVCEGEFTYAPVTDTYPAAGYWGINVTSCTYGKHTVIHSSTAGIVDTGTTLVLIADDFFARYMHAIPGAKVDSNTGLIEIPRRSISSMHPLNFTIAGQVFSLDVAAQLIPKDQNTAWGGDAKKRYGVVNFMGSRSGQGMDFIIGQKFLERYYSVFDTDSKRVGFART
ncbi:acid protease [Boletus edulis BED1]|uniref:Acid protease n=1 Tax=Boletus edulis BED1 TaxID=1328754 RepID=A0AAD4GKY4_BOLED|nr:acid protease [Boletus edulis BED1]